MRFLTVSSLVLLVALSNAMPQQQSESLVPQQRPQHRQRPNNMASRFRSMMDGAIGDLSGVYDRMRNGFTRTFSGATNRLNGFRNAGPAARSPVDPAVHTNEIHTPARNSNEGAPNAPVAQAGQRPFFNRRPSGFVRRVQQFVGNMRNMFQSFNRRMAGGNRRNQFQGQPQIVPQHQVNANHQQVATAAQQQQTGEFKPLH